METKPGRVYGQAICTLATFPLLCASSETGQYYAYDLIVQSFLRLWALLSLALSLPPSVCFTSSSPPPPLLSFVWDDSLKLRDGQATRSRKVASSNTSRAQITSRKLWSGWGLRSHPGVERGLLLRCSLSQTLLRGLSSTTAGMSGSLGLGTHLGGRQSSLSSGDATSSHSSGVAWSRTTSDFVVLLSPGGVALLSSGHLSSAPASNVGMVQVFV